MEHSTSSHNTINTGIKHYLNDEFMSAIKAFSVFLDSNPIDFKARLYRAISYISLQKFEEALVDLNDAENFSTNHKSFELFFRKGQTLFNLEKFIEANDYFKKALILQSTQSDRDKLALWANKLEIELSERDLLNQIDPQSDAEKDKASLDALKFTHNWYQNATFITLSLESNTPIEKEKFEFVLEKKSIKLIHKVAQKAIFEMSLSNSIVPEYSKYSVINRRIEFNLKKEVENFNWITVDRKKVEETSSTFKQSYPTSSKKKKDWDNLEKEINEELVSDAKTDPNEGMMKLFRDIYERSDENTRRAMIKSFQTSGGTVLSTNWGEVKDKDYEGRDRPEAPKGQEWRK